MLPDADAEASTTMWTRFVHRVHQVVRQSMPKSCHMGNAILSFTSQRDRREMAEALDHQIETSLRRRTTALSRWVCLTGDYGLPFTTIV